MGVGEASPGTECYLIKKPTILPLQKGDTARLKLDLICSNFCPEGDRVRRWEEGDDDFI